MVEWVELRITGTWAPVKEWTSLLLDITILTMPSKNVNCQNSEKQAGILRKRRIPACFFLFHSESLLTKPQL